MGCHPVCARGCWLGPHRSATTLADKLEGGPITESVTLVARCGTHEADTEQATRNAIKPSLHGFVLPPKEFRCATCLAPHHFVQKVGSHILVRNRRDLGHRWLFGGMCAGKEGVAVAHINVLLAPQQLCIGGVPVLVRGAAQQPQGPCVLPHPHKVVWAPSIRHALKQSVEVHDAQPPPLHQPPQFFNRDRPAPSHFRWDRDGVCPRPNHNLPPLTVDRASEQGAWQARWMGQDPNGETVPCIHSDKGKPPQSAGPHYGRDGKGTQHLSPQVLREVLRWVSHRCAPHRQGHTPQGGKGGGEGVVQRTPNAHLLPPQLATLPLLY
eukprot:Sspe_Gene.86879::Locus_57672_Transcript_1_2_Confidence_0.500_Length_1239::g.86879::m.86879